MPRIIDNASSSPILINEHENLTMQCQAMGQPTPYVTWFRRTNPSDADNSVLANSTDGQYHLVNVIRDQAGHYECRASNGVNGHVVSKHIELRVLCK